MKEMVALAPCLLELKDDASNEICRLFIGSAQQPPFGMPGGREGTAYTVELTSIRNVNIFTAILLPISLLVLSIISVPSINISEDEISFLLFTDVLDFPVMDIFRMFLNGAVIYLSLTGLLDTDQ